MEEKIEDMELKFHTDLKKGLTNRQIELNRKEYGDNQLKEKKHENFFVKFLKGFKDTHVIKTQWL